MKYRIVSLFLLVSTSCLAKDYYVDAGTDEGGDGTAAAPFRTIQQAAHIMRPGDVCLIASGVYPESVRPSASGTAGNPLIFSPAGPDQQVLVTGADPVPWSLWGRQEDNSFRARLDMDLDHENQVFLGERMLIEARWPNTGDDLLEPVLSVMDQGTTPELIVDADLPDLDWRGASVWIHAPRYWSDWTTQVLSFGEDRLEIENIAPYPEPRRHVAAPGADYFVYGCRAALDTVNEWFYDESEGCLYIFRPDGRLPREPYYIKKRMTAFDLSGRSHIHIKDLHIQASTVVTDESSRHILLDGLNISHPYHSSEANSYYGTQTGKGVLVMGTACMVRGCEIAHGSGCGIALGGQYNLVFNCYIHETDYIGTYASSIVLRGKGNIISHCTLSRTGRSLIDYGGMYKALIQFCDMNQSGLLTSDTGLTYGNVIEGGGSEVRYNWMHDNLDKHLSMGLYYDHGTQNILSHHNIIWGIDHFGFLINHYAYYHLVYNNTFSAGTHGFRSTWGNQYEPDLHGCRFFNNIFSEDCLTTAGNYSWGNNVQGYNELTDHKYLKEGSPCIDAGIVIPGINEDFTGKAPDIGACEFGGVNWQVGHDFENPPDLDTTRSEPLYRNRLENPAFEHEDNVFPWEASGEVYVQSGRKGQGTPDTARIRMGSASLSLGSGSEISQLVKGLEPDSWYEFAGFLRVDRGEQVILGVRNREGAEQCGPTMAGNAPGWNRVLVNFKTDPVQTEATVFVRRLAGGRGIAFVDDCGLVFLHRNH